MHPLDPTIELESLGGVVERVRASPRGRAVVVTRGDDEGEDQPPPGASSIVLRDSSSPDSSVTS